MEKIFGVGEGIAVPDGTIIHSILDPRIASQGMVPWIDDVSFTFGRIPPGVTSKIHLHPVIKQLTWILSGRLTIKMKDPTSETAYALELSENQMSLTEAGTFFQMINTNDEECRVLYVNAPGFIFELAKDGSVLYNDALVLDQNWDELSAMDWVVPQIVGVDAFKRERDKSRQRLKSSLDKTI